MILDAAPRMRGVLVDRPAAIAAASPTGLAVIEAVNSPAPAGRSAGGS